MRYAMFSVLIFRSLVLHYESSPAQKPWIEYPYVEFHIHKVPFVFGSPRWSVWIDTRTVQGHINPHPNSQDSSSSVTSIYPPLSTHPSRGRSCRFRAWTRNTPRVAWPCCVMNTGNFKKTGDPSVVQRLLHAEPLQNIRGTRSALSADTINQTGAPALLDMSPGINCYYIAVPRMLSLDFVSLCDPAGDAYCETLPVRKKNGSVLYVKLK